MSYTILLDACTQDGNYFQVKKIKNLFEDVKWQIIHIKNATKNTAAFLLVNSYGGR
jgi:hypothetical protein